MNLDIEDVLAGAVGGVIARGLMFAAAVWAGCALGVCAISAGDVALGGGFPRTLPADLIAGPLRLASLPGIANVAFLLIALTYYILSERPGFLAWGVVSGVQSLVVLAGWAWREHAGAWQSVVTWLAWAFLLAAWAVGLWVLRVALGWFRARRIRPAGGADEAADEDDGG